MKNAKIRSATLVAVIVCSGAFVLVWPAVVSAVVDDALPYFAGQSMVWRAHHTPWLTTQHERDVVAYLDGADASMRARLFSYQLEMKRQLEIAASVRKQLIERAEP